MRSLKIAHIDTWLDTEHPSLKGRFLQGRNIIQDNEDIDDENGHGTATAGVIVASYNFDQQLGGIVTENIKLMPLKVAGENGKTRLSYILKGLVLAAKEESKVAFIGFPVPAVRSLREAINFFEPETEGLVVMPAAHYEPFIKKSKHSSRFVVSTVDNSGNSPHWAPTHGADIFAPGVHIWTTAKGGKHAWFNGTSFSAAITAGIFGLLLSIPNLSHSNRIWLQTILNNPINAFKAVQNALYIPEDNLINFFDVKPCSSNQKSPLCVFVEDALGLFYLQIQGNNQIVFMKNLQGQKELKLELPERILSDESRTNSPIEIHISDVAGNKTYIVIGEPFNNFSDEKLKHEF